MDTQFSDDIRRLQLDEMIRFKINDCRQKSEGFLDPTSLELFDYPLFLHIILSTFELEVLDIEKCGDYLVENWDFTPYMELAYSRNNFWELQYHPSLARLRKGDVKPIPFVLTGSSQSRAAFEQPYRGDLPRLFKEALDEYAESDSGLGACEKVYNRSIVVIQSSGTGKSRLVDEMGYLGFTIPINLGESRLSNGSKAYPPPDEALLDFFNSLETKSNELIQAEFAVFLSVLFDFVALKVNEIGKGREGVQLAVKWAEHIKEGQNLKTVGAHRSELYKNVIQETKKVLRGVPAMSDTLDCQRIISTLVSRTRQSCSRLKKALAPNKSPYDQRNLCYVYFDGAHCLAKRSSDAGSSVHTNPYHSFGRVLEQLRDLPLFFIFLSRNTNLQQFPPPPCYHPSITYSPGRRIFPPFTELPFDVFVEEGLKKLDVVSLDNVCTTDFMSHFGRPIWFAHHQQWRAQQRPRNPGKPWPEKLVSHVFYFAMEKIGAYAVPEKSIVPNLAAIGVRIGLNFNLVTQASRSMEATHVNSYMRVIYAMPEHREYMRTGSPSEPILAEGAAMHLEKRSERFMETGILEAGPRILADSCNVGLLEGDERGELCGRLLLTIAHDLVIQELPDSGESETIYHRPIPVLAFLRALFAKPHHDALLNATPVHFNVSSEGLNEPRILEEAFKNAYVSFSHFAVVNDVEALDLSQLQYSLIRGCAIQVEKGRSIDAIIPIHIGDIRDPITPETTSAICLQFQNRKNPQRCYANLPTVSNIRQPGISIMFELGEEHPSSPLVHSYHEHRPETPNREVHTDDHHYGLIAHGHGPETFNVVSVQSKSFYGTILRTGDSLYDFPRAKNERLVTYFENMRRPLQSTHTRALFSSPAPLLSDSCQSW
ncbi:unnamed protein product [Rhizoctonia solani]|uniref:Uncharacterized protein n=1 Tax=Rhizoctonia solani TaxID=456999 RepID=A0A8H3DUE3_9AGAM|nr:unnamed protein product [Rhizoctonia solani]